MVKSAVSLVSKAALPPESPQQIGSPVGSCQLDAAMVNSASSNFTPTQEKDRRLSGEGCVIYMLYAAALGSKLATPWATVDSDISPVQVCHKVTGYARLPSFMSQRRTSAAHGQRQQALRGTR